MNKPRQHGVSLIEALVAVAVLAFGVLGIAGMQMGLRQNSDVSKQRSEAVRIAQIAIENARDYSLIDADNTVCTACSFAEIASSGPTDVTPAVSNATYSLTITSPAIAADAPRLKQLRVDVDWTDRSGQAQGPVTLTTYVAGVPPQLAGTLAVPVNTAAMHLPRGRNIAVPQAAIDQGNGTSLFTPPGGGGVTWTFDNVSGVVTLVCDTFGICITTNLFVVSGHIRFAITTVQPLPAQAEVPPGPAPLDPTIVSGVEIDLTSPSTSVVACFAQVAGSDSIAYICAVPTTVTMPVSWSGRSILNMGALAGSLADNTSSHFKVCRYTPAATDTPSRGNIDHPLVYTTVTGSLSNQNFLVIPAGNGTSTFSCPGDDTSTPYVNGQTYRHQPLS